MKKVKSLTRTDYSLRRHLFLGGMSAIALVFGLGGWAVFTNLAGAVVASGTVSVEGQVKKIQHPTGGVVTNIYVKEGARVKEGELLMSLDETTNRSTMLVYSKQIDEAKARIARLEAEEKGNLRPIWPIELSTRLHEADVKKITVSELELMDSRIMSIDGQRKQLQERITQTSNEISGIKIQLESRKVEAELLKREMRSVEGLERQGYTTLNRFITVKRDFSRLEGDRDNLKTELDKANSRLSEADVTLKRLDQDNRKEVITEIRDVKNRLNELLERFTAAEDMFHRAQIKSPFNGIAHQLSVNSVGGVVQPGESIVQIVPDNTPLLIEAKIAQTDIDQLRLGENAVVRFSAFNQRTTPELMGKLTHISPDLAKDKEPSYMQQMPFYLVRITLSAEEIKKLKEKTLQPGMSAEVFIHTENRSAMSYLMKPITDQMMKAFVER